MKVELTDVGVCEKRVEIHCDAEEVKAEYDKFFKAYRSEVTIPGFRKGHAPAEAIKKKFQKEIMSRVRESLEREGIRQMFHDHVIRVVGEDEPEREGGQDETQAYDFRLTIQVMPDYKIPDYKGLEIEARDTAPTEEDIDAAVKQTLLDRGAPADAEPGDAAAAGDLVQLDFTGTVDGQAPGTFSEKAKVYDRRENFWAMAADGSFFDGYCKELVGLKTGDKKSFSVELPAARQEELGLPKPQLELEVEVKKIRKIRPAEPTPEFFKSIGVADMDALRERLKATREMMNRRQEEMRRIDQAQAALLERTGTLEFSKKAIDQRVNADVYLTVTRLREHGISADDIRRELPRIEEQARAAAPRELTLRAMLKTVSDAEETAVTQDDFQRMLRYAMERARAKSLGELAARMNCTEEDYKNDMIDSIRVSAARSALLAYAKWTGPAAEEASREAKRHYRATVVRTVHDNAEWDEWAKL